MLLHLDFCVNASWKRKILQAVDSLWCCTKDIDEALVDFHFESFTTGLVNVWRFHNGESAALGRKWHWAGNASAGTNSGVNDLFCALINNAVIISLEADANFKTLILGGLGGFSCFSFCHFILSISTISDCD